ncbi:MAG: DUF1598 domain-containing protein [Planctomycetaceae bacterium]|nr:DUF1598 domain-containing protein [Planctomycetaceae bacterium]
MQRSSLSLILAVVVCQITVAADNRVSDSAYLQSENLKIQARISAERGDFSGAVEQILQASELVGDRTTAKKARQASESQAAGGSPFANFGEIIQLIQEQTAPPARWIQTDGEGGALSISQQGVFLGSPAVMATLALMADDTPLLRAANLARKANHNTDPRTQSALRLISLPRLEAHVAELLKQGHPVPEDVRTLAGVNKVEFLFVYPDTGDIVIGGPAGEWTRESDGRYLNVDSGRPTLLLDDLVTLSRAFSPQGQGFFLCTIDPKKSQVAAVQEFVKANRRTLSATTAAAFTHQLESMLGLQNVIVQGIANDSRVASVIVDADYRMKEIGIGRREGPEGMKSYFDLLTRSEQRGSGSMDALRWWMAVGYESIRTAANHQAFQFSGRSIQCLSEDQIVGDHGERTATGKASRANAKFAELFTRHLPELADMDPVFADLQNVFDLAMATALIHSPRIAAQSNWNHSVFANDGEFRTKSVEVPSELMTAAHHRVYAGGSIVIQVAGGVRFDAGKILNDNERFVTDPGLTNRNQAASPIGHRSDRWWWDASSER